MNDRMTPAELRASFALGAIHFLRMFGLFLMLPVFALYAEDLHGATPLLIGVAIGAYGCTQALLQIPFGSLSDRYGRKRMITLGLALFALGSIIAAMADGIHGVILGRALQGAGAISAAIMALAADLTREESRAKAMAIIGISIGVSFGLAFVVAPALGQAVGLSGLFWASALLGIGGIAVLHGLVPTPVRTRFHRECETEGGQIRRVLRDSRLLHLDLGIFFLHMMLTASFVVLPLALRDGAGLPADRHWQVYLPVLVISVVCILPFLRMVDGQRRIKEVFVGAILLLAAAQFGLWVLHGTLIELCILLLLYFTAFNFLEASLPALISRAAPAELKGTALGVYSTGQFLGTFIGGVAGGWLHGRHGMDGVFLFCCLIGLAWAGVAATMRPPRRLVSRSVKVGPVSPDEARALSARYAVVPGVAEVVVLAEDGIAHLKFDPATVDLEALTRVAGAPIVPG